MLNNELDIFYGMTIDHILCVKHEMLLLLLANQLISLVINLGFKEYLKQMTFKKQHGSKVLCQMALRY